MSAFVAAALLLGSAGWAQTGQTGTTTTILPMGKTIAPRNIAPERDARGVPVISAPALAPHGFNQIHGSTAVAAPTMVAVGAAASASAYAVPPCTHTVTDNCIQLYEFSGPDTRLPPCPGHPSCRRRPKD